MLSRELLEQQVRSATAETRCRIAESMLVSQAAWHSIRASRRRLLARLPIAGGAPTDDPEAALRAHVRAQIASGGLPRISGEAWAGVSHGHRKCACCEQPIADSTPEYEPRDRPGLFAHVLCFMLWRNASRAGEANTSMNAAAGLVERRTRVGLAATAKSSMHRASQTAKTALPLSLGRLGIRPEALARGAPWDFYPPRGCWAGPRLPRPMGDFKKIVRRCSARLSTGKANNGAHLHLLATTSRARFKPSHRLSLLSPCAIVGRATSKGIGRMSVSLLLGLARRPISARCPCEPSTLPRLARPTTA